MDDDQFFLDPNNRQLLLQNIRTIRQQIMQDMTQQQIIQANTLPTLTPIGLPEESEIKNDTYEKFFENSDIVVEKAKHETCIITLEDIEENEIYHKCSQCEQSISTEALSEWWKTSLDNKGEVCCPSCRKKWDNSKLYINKS